MAGRISEGVAVLSLDLEAKGLGVFVVDPVGEMSGHVGPLDFVEESIGVDGDVEDGVFENVAVGVAQIGCCAGRGLAVQGKGDTIGNGVALAAAVAWSAKVGRRDDRNDASDSRFLRVDLLSSCQTGENGRGCAVDKRDRESCDVGTTCDSGKTVDGLGVSPVIVVFVLLRRLSVDESNRQDRKKSDGEEDFHFWFCFLRDLDFFSKMKKHFCLFL